MKKSELIKLINKRMDNIYKVYVSVPRIEENFDNLHIIARYYVELKTALFILERGFIPYIEEVDTAMFKLCSKYGLELPNDED